jgi:type III restriction enzyme
VASRSPLVKIPQLPSRDVTGSATPPYFNVWRWVEEMAEAEGYSGTLKPPVILRYAAAPIIQMAAEWRKTFDLWQAHYASGLRRSPAPPVFILVCRDTALARELYDWLANGTDAYGQAPAHFKNEQGHEVTVRIDSKVGEEIEAGVGSDEVKRLRYVLSTIGNTEWRGGKVPEDYALLVEKHNAKALEDDSDLEWVDASVPPGRDVRCIISVAMLSEGWDATTVTHVVGLRPFGSQLLCEQVVGRALRRTSYDIDPETNLFREETAKVFGVPFELIPFKTGPGGPPPPTPPSNHVYAVPEKAELEVSFPVVEGYHDPGLVSVELDWNKVPTLTLDPLEIPDSTLVANLCSADGSLIPYGPGTPELVDLSGWRQRTRPQRVAFMLARHLTERWVREHGDAILPHVLFPRLLELVRRFMAERLDCKGARQPCDIAISPYYNRAAEALFAAMSAVDRCGKTELPVIAEGAEGTRSTGTVDFRTGRDLWPVQKCHLNAMVADTKTWEQSAAYALDTHAGVIRWAKNDHLWFHIPYRRGGLQHSYTPDFLAVLEVGLNLIVEVKGLSGDDAEIKQAAAKRWVDAVNLDGRFGLWTYEIVRHPGQLTELLDGSCLAECSGDQDV